jgi:outer membrane protein assembly factor BamC
LIETTANSRSSMNKLHTAVIITCLLALAGCHTLGIEKKRVDYKSAAASSSESSLEVPPDLTTPQAEDRYAIPEGNGENVESYSDYAKGAGSQQQQGAVSNVLPPVKGVHLEHSGTQYWLVVDGPAESVWPKVKQFWQENGFTLKTDNPQAGVMETNWLENRANIPQGSIRNLLGKVFSDVYDSGLRDRYMTRLERSQDGNSTNVYITHYGMQEVLTGTDKDSSKWEPRPRDPDLEAAMLQMLMARLGGNTPAAATAGGEAAPGGAQPMLQRMSDGSTAIVLRGESFGPCWQSVETALDQAGIAVVDKDRASGVLYLRAQKKESGILDELEFWKSNKDSQPRIEVLVHQDDNGCMVTASADDGSTNAATRQVIDTLYRAMNAQAVPVAVAQNAGGSAPGFRSAPPRLQEASGNKTIVIGESLDLCWNDALAALDRAKMSPIDTDRVAGKLYLPAADRDVTNSWFSRLAFWKTGDIKMARPEVVVRAVSGGCEISANDGNGGTNEATQQIIDVLYQNLNR